MSVLIAIAHGSRNPAWRATVEKQIESLQADIGPEQLQLAYMELSPPTLLDVVEKAVLQGIRSFRVLPLFLTGAGHVERDIRPLVNQIRTKYDSVDLELLPPIGQHPLFLDMIRTIAID